MNAQTQNMPAQMNSVGLLNLEAFELSQRVAKMLASSTLVPEQYRAMTKVKAGKDNNGQWVYQDVENPNGLSNCVIALNMANRMGADPLMIMQNLYLIEGRPSWSSQFIMASINSCGRFSSLRFEIEDLGEKEVEYQETAWVSGRKQSTTKKIKIQNISCIAWVIERESGERLESSKISIEMAVKEGWYQKNGSKWQTMPEQMLRYRAASFFGRVYAPELLMGLRSADEEQDRIIDITPEEKTVTLDYSQLKRKILAVKSPADLDVLEDEIFNITDEEPRKELIKLAKAQSNKFQPVKEIVPESKPEVVKEQVPPVEKAVTETKAPVKEQPKVDAIDPANSDMAKGGLLTLIQKAKDVAELETLAKTITNTKPRMLPGHHQELLNAYAQRKEILAQADIFDDEPTSYVDSAISRIRNAISQDAINDVYADPAFEELSGVDRELIDQEAQQREAELQE